MDGAEPQEEVLSPPREASPPPASSPELEIVAPGTGERRFSERRKRLEKARDKRTDNRALRRLAQQHSEDEDTKARGGDLRYFPRDGTPQRGGTSATPSLTTVPSGNWIVPSWDKLTLARTSGIGADPSA